VEQLGGGSDDLRRPTVIPVDPGRRRTLAYRDAFGRADSARAEVNPQVVFSAYLARLRREHPGLRQRSYGDAVLGGGDVSYVFFHSWEKPSSPARRRPRAAPVDRRHGRRRLGPAGAESIWPTSPVDVRVCRQGPEGVAWRRIIDTASDLRGQPQLLVRRPPRM
jgi:isoamylase